MSPACHAVTNLPNPPGFGKYMIAENCQSITAWTGFLGPSCKMITAKWQLVVNGTTDPSQILQGSDTFTKVSSARTSRGLVEKQQ